MEVKIGVQYAPREIVIDVDDPPEDVQRELGRALEESGVFALKDVKGRQVLVPAANIAYVELGNPSAPTVGFR